MFDLADRFDARTDPVLVADLDHVIRYMNPAAAAFYEGGADLMGSNLLDCHEEEASRTTIREILVQMGDGLDEKLYYDEDGEKVFMVAVRSGDGSLLGYYERYEPVPERE
jgi:PAS domain-containing protein